MYNEPFAKSLGFAVATHDAVYGGSRRHIQHGSWAPPVFRKCLNQILAMACALLAAASATAAPNWPDWRGPAADGHTHAEGLPIAWSETNNIAWKTAIHDEGHSTPVVWDGQIWLTTAKEDGTVLYAVCVDADTGAIGHDIAVFHVDNPQNINALNTYATPSAAIETGRVFVHYGALGTACIDTASGDVLWRRADLNCDHMQGPASSPILFEDMVILTIEGTDAQFMAALDKKTGQTVWRYERPEDLYTPDLKPVYIKSYQTPVILEIGGAPQLISNGALLATGHNPRTGEELWRILYRDDSTISRIVAGDGLLFINTGGCPGGSQLWALREPGTGDLTESHVVWKRIEQAPHQSSPVLVDGLLYAVTDEGRLICLEAETGDEVWYKRLRGKHSASLLAAPGRIYVSSIRGVTTVFAPGRAFEQLASNELDGELWASPAVAGNALLLRTKTHLYRIEKPK